MITRRDFFKIAAASGALASVGQIVEAKSNQPFQMKGSAMKEHVRFR